mgnify:FL=1
MNDFKGLSRDTSWLKTPSDMWHFARNIILTAQYLSIANEKGTEFGFNVPGQIIGAVATNEDLLFFSIDGSYSCIGYVNHSADVYIPVLRTMNPNFKFKPSCPIEAVCMYNYKKELITVFSDGVHKNSSTPKLINVYKPQVTLSSSKEFINDSDYTSFELFSPIKLPTVYFDYANGNLRAGVVHMAFCYIFEDDTESSISPIISTTYPSFKGINTQYRKVNYGLNDLSSNFSRVKLFFVVHYDGAINGYATPIIDIVDSTVDYTLSSLVNLDIIAPEEILIPSSRFSKIKTITKSDNQILVANVETPFVENYQKYANKLKLNLNCLIHEEDMEKFKSHPSLMPDEVYSIRIVPIFLDGTKGNALHIPGPPPTNNDVEVLSDNQIIDMGLDFPAFLGKGYKRFHFENSGILANSYTNSKFGYWENDDLYPNKDYYNSSDIGGEDLRGKNIRYHKIPTVEPQQPSIATDWRSVASTDNKESIGFGIGYSPKIYVTVDNFLDVFPSDIVAKLQGYELVIEKRLLGATYVETNGVLYRPLPLEGMNYVKATLDDGSANGVFVGNVDFKHSYPRTFTNSFFISTETVRDNIDISATLVKCYYSITQKIVNEDNRLDPSNNVVITYFPAINQKIGYIEKAEYRLANNIASNNSYNGDALALTIKSKDPTKVDHYNNGTFDEYNATIDGYSFKDDFVPIDPFDITNSPNYGSGSAGTDTFPGSNQHVKNVLIFASLITLNKRLYNLEAANDFVSLGTHIFVPYSNGVQAIGNDVAGDVFTTNIIKKVFTGVAKIEKYSANSNLALLAEHLNIFTQSTFYLFNMYSPLTNIYIENGSVYYNSKSGINSNYYNNWQINYVNLLNSFNYTTLVKSKPISNHFNTYVESLSPGLTEKLVNYFPYRVHKGLAIPSESLQTSNMRFFPTNSYHDMPNDKGEIIALRGINNGVYIQQRWSLYKSTVSDKITNNEQEVYLGSTILFDRNPDEVIGNGDIGYIGSNSQFACFVFRDGYVTVDEESGKIFIINNEISEASQRNMSNSFREVLPLGNHYSKIDIFDKKTKTDNPFLSVGYIVGFDKENNRILVTKKYYNPKTLTRLMDFDGEFYYDTNGKILDFNDPSYFYNESRTFSFALDSKTWVCEHDYFPNAYLYNNKGFYAIMNKFNENSKFYRFNSKSVNPGNFFGVQHESYVDLIFNTRLDLSKQYQAVNWVSESKDVKTNQLLQFKTIDKIMVYNYHQCSGIIPVKNNNFDNTRDNTARNTESQWKFNEFRDMLINPESMFLKVDGTYNSNAIALNKVWFEKNMFIGNFVATRLIWDNQDNRITYIHNVQVKSVNSSR